MRELLTQIYTTQKLFPREVREEIYNTAFVDVESFIKKNDIPVDTGRLRASFYTKTTWNPTHEYSDRSNNSFDGTLSERVDKDSVVVGSNVEYAELMNERGGGGENSRRTVRGQKRSKGYGQGFFDKAIKNGEEKFARRIEKLARKLGDQL